MPIPRVFVYDFFMRFRLRGVFDRYQKFGLFTLAFSLFFMTAVARGSARVLFIGGIAYGLLFIFHNAAERLARKHVTRPLLAYGIAVVANGMFMEVLAYLSNLDLIRAGKKAMLFSQDSLLMDLAIGLPFYLLLSGIYCWALRRYVLTTFQMAAIIGLFWAIGVDEFTHARALLAGNVAEFLLAGLIMLFTLHGPIVVFEKQLQEAYPGRKSGWQRFPVVFFLQLLAFAGPIGAIILKLSLP